MTLSTLLRELAASGGFALLAPPPRMKRKQKKISLAGADIKLPHAT